jgi:hypothetical protein
MAEESEEGFTVRDRRRFLSDVNEAPEETPAGRGAAVGETAAGSADDALGASRHAAFASPGAFVDESDDSEESSSIEENALPDIYSVLMLFLGEMRSHAWLRMGLVANPVTGMIERDLTQARVAIDTAVFLAGQIEGVLPPEERLPLRAMISDLQINFVEQSKRG